MALHTRRDLEKLADLAGRSSSSALMSDTKWRKLIEALSDPSLHIAKVFLGFIDTSHTLETGHPRFWGLHPPKPWVEFNGMPIELRSIEWLRVPKTARELRSNGDPPREIEQDVEVAFAMIKTLGQFPVELDTSGLLVTAYRK